MGHSEAFSRRFTVISAIYASGAIDAGDTGHVIRVSHSRDGHRHID
jgi:hypothetical protein